MNKELEALEDLHVYALGSYELEEDYKDNEKHYNFVQNEYKLLKSALERKEKLEKAFHTLSKEDEKTKKLLSKEIEKNRAFEIIRDKKVDVPYIMENPEAENVFWYNSSFTGVLCEGWRMLSQEEYDLVRKALLYREDFE